MINSRNLYELHPKVMQMCMEFTKRCKEQGIDILITSTYRDNESQTQLYNQGRITKGPIVTNAGAGESYHNYRCAFDFVPMKFGKCMWEDTATFTRCGEIAESINLEWAGRWTGKLRELAHCQYTDGLSLRDLQAGKKISS